LASPETSLYHPVRVSTLIVAGNLWLAPMAGYTDVAFRSVCARQGASLCFTEMASADALARSNRTTFRLLEKTAGDALTAFQIFGSRPAVSAAAVRLIAPMAPAIIDLNCGCSVPKVLKAECGAALMRIPALIGSIVAAMKSETDIPVSVKLRLGWDDSCLTYLACAEAAVKAGAALVTLHPRTRAQGFSGSARWEHIGRLKRAVDVPVAGSGDLLRAGDCARMLADTGCDAVMIARGTLGNPFIFRQARALLCGDAVEGPLEARIRLGAAMDHLRLLAESVGEAKACRDMRKHFVAYTKGLERGSFIRENVVRAERIEEYEQIVESYLRD
jgi:tRNA-dihydrouridine synthase B